MSQFIEMFGSYEQNTPWSEVVAIMNGKAYPSEYQKEGSFPICGSGGIMYYGEQKLCNGNTIILGRKGNINSPLYMESDYWIVDTAFSLDVDKDILHPKYFYFWCCQYDFTKLNKQGVLPSLTRKDLEKVKMAIPPMEQQEQFVTIAEQADKSKFADFKSQFIEMFGTVENNIYNYPIMNIGEFACCFAGATPSTSHPEYWENGTIRWMSSGEVHKSHVEDTDSRITELGYKSASTKMVPIHSIVIALAGQGKTRGSVAVTEVELCTNQSLCAIVPDERVNYLYLYHNLLGRYLELRGLSGDVNGRGGLNLKIIQKIPVILPPMDKQKQFVAIAEQADKSKSHVLKALKETEFLLQYNIRQVA